MEVVYELEASERRCTCGKALARIGEEVLEQLAVIPQQYYVIRHVRPTFACPCKACIRSASMPAQPLPACQVSPQLLAHVMVSKYLDGLSVTLCNDHARCRFHKVCAGLGKEKAAGSIAQQGLQWYRQHRFCRRVDEGHTK